MTDRNDNRYVENDHPEARFEAWMNAAPMGGWTGEEVEDFEQAIRSELEYADADRADEAMSEVEITEVA